MSDPAEIEAVAVGGSFPAWTIAAGCAALILALCAVESVIAAGSEAV